jgi:hypothetical protein
MAATLGKDKTFAGFQQKNCRRLSGLVDALPTMVGGAPPAPAELGHSVVMVLGSAGTACTASAIGRDLLLTAAHCVQPGADYKLVGSAPGHPRRYRPARAAADQIV